MSKKKTLQEEFSLPKHELNSINRDIGVVIIGRNEGEKLHKAFSSLPLTEIEAIYVDSGSSDGSVKLAYSSDLRVHCLDPNLPFSPSRGRAEGVSKLTSICPKLQFIQFLDGDCELLPNWIMDAVNYLKKHSDVGIVCGMITESNPSASIYNKLSPQRWILKSGDVEACGGIFMIRHEVYEKVGGFNEKLITREEDDLCRRVRNIGYRVVRIDVEMAKHDSGMLRFDQWLVRAVWGGYGDAVLISSAPFGRKNWQRLRWYLLWILVFPVFITLGSVGLLWSTNYIFYLLLSLSMMGYFLLRILVARIRQNDTFFDAMLFAFFSLVRNFFCGYGFVKYFFIRGNERYRPDPHAPEM